MHFPITIVDDFFAKPYLIKELSKKFEYNTCEKGAFPGQRTYQLGTLEDGKLLFDFTCKKFLSILYPTEGDEINFIAQLHFQRISNEYKNPGFIHCDTPIELTALVYLSDHENCGTTFYEPIDGYPFGCAATLEKKYHIYKNKDFTDELETVNHCNKNFKEILNVPSKFNRAVLFDGSYYHGVKNFVNNNIDEDRLTLIAFFHSIEKTGIKYPITENKRRG